MAATNPARVAGPPYTTTPLYKLVKAKVPSAILGEDISISRLAAMTGYCRYTFYRRFENNSVSPGIAKALLIASAAAHEETPIEGGPLTQDMLTPFLFT